MKITVSPDRLVIQSFKNLKQLVQFDPALNQTTSPLIAWLEANCLDDEWKKLESFRLQSLALEYEKKGSVKAAEALRIAADELSKE